MKPLVSVLIPSYNSQEWLADAIESALAQTWERTEIVVVDDGSKDQTVAVAKRFESPRVKVICQENRGAAAARNTAFAACQGDYIQWLDADDVLDPDKVARQVARAPDVGVRGLLSGAWAYFSYRRRVARFSPSPLWADLAPVEWLYRKMSLNLHMQTDNWLVSRELTDAAGPWDTRLWRDNDGEYFCRVLLASAGVHFVNDARSYYRRAGFSNISYIAGSNKKLESLFLSMTLHIQYLRSLEESERTRAACVTYLQAWIHEFLPYRPDLAAQLSQRSVELGGGDIEPRLSWRYNWIAAAFGRGPAKQVQLVVPRVRLASRIALTKHSFTSGSENHRMLQPSPKVSIFTPVYNEEKHLAECIESVQRQTYTNWVYTIVDNCSTDGSAAVAQRYADSDPRINVLRPSEFVSSFANCNRALRTIAADSKYCKIVLADDWIFPDCLEKMVALAEQHPSVGLVGAYILEGDRVIATGMSYRDTCVTGRDACRAHLLENQFVFGSQNSVLYRADLVRAHDPFFEESDPHADTEVCFALLRQADFGFVHQVLTYTRVRPGSLYARALSLRTDLGTTLNLVEKHGDVFLTPAERAHLRKLHGDIYYAELGRNLVRRRGDEFWKYHVSQLNQLLGGYQASRVLTGLLRSGFAAFARRARVEISR